jgi:alpha-ketoglutarate-dependent taurine dioxygenase
MVKGLCNYELHPLSRLFGAQVLGVDLATVDLSSSSQIVNQLKKDLVQHRALLFCDQNLSGERQVEISNKFGTIESTFYKHPRSPHPDVFRVSNDESEGCTNVGRSGWHIDGTFQICPFQFQAMFFESASTGGDTYFMPLKEFYDSVPLEIRQTWDRLWMVTRSSRRAPTHPLVYQHPFRNETTMLFHCGRPFVEGWWAEDESGIIDRSNMIPAGVIQKQLTKYLDEKLDELGLVMQWKTGDFMINDNLGLAHFASEGTQANRSKAGLRILHRTTIVGGPETTPTKSDGRTSFIL